MGLCFSFDCGDDCCSVNPCCLALSACCLIPCLCPNACGQQEQPAQVVHIHHPPQTFEQPPQHIHHPPTFAEQPGYPGYPPPEQQGYPGYPPPPGSYPVPPPQGYYPQVQNR
ncbi:hypothetical protein JYU34_004637 [Plutella xylostella]|uniref:Uncharacterized protein n=1 Tax=Plutella xylostella TaxID=51655 RepID=A0ABQ7QYH7_PLUXY|nr:hypothetical protein JYU34_004637 [Plutella xylostella]